MSWDNDGGPAFPHLRSECQRVNETEMYEGMTLRDYFAGQALAGMWASDNENFRLDAEFTAIFAYKYADAMIKERDK